MKLAVRVKLLPTPEQASALGATLRACNEAASWLSSEAFTHQVTSRAGLQAHAYVDLRLRGLSAQPALHVVRKVADAYAALKVTSIRRTPVRNAPGVTTSTGATGRRRPSSSAGSAASLSTRI
ncbi:hypothetical protein [Streptomyces sp. NPDC059378]|uniref:hypothetical protein n=1 Tax=Streptomyces sp. NPDC059378 TaxID=3346815 RepID=UPI0036BE31E6